MMLHNDCMGILEITRSCHYCGYTLQLRCTACRRSVWLPAHHCMLAPVGVE